MAHAKIGNEEFIFKYSANRISDENVAEHYQERFNNDYIKACQDLMDNDTYLEFPSEILIDTNILANGQYSTDFDKLPVSQGMWLLGIKNYDKMLSEDDSKNMASKIANQLLGALGEHYNFESIQMFYIDKFGAYEIVINNKELTIDELLKNTKKLDNSEIGEEEKAFIEHFNP